MKKSAIALLAAGLMFGTTAMADTDIPGGLYVNFDVGSSRLGAHAADFDRIAAGVAGSGATVVESHFDRRARGWSLTLYGMQGERFGIEVGRLKLDPMSYDARVNVDSGAGPSQLPIHIGMRSRGWTLAGLGLVHLTDALQLEGRAGAYFGRTRTTASYPADGGGSVRFRDKDYRASLMLNAGLLYSPQDKPYGLTLAYTWLDDVAGRHVSRVSLGVRFWVARGSP
jgi:hypothetical protein